MIKLGKTFVSAVAIAACVFAGSSNARAEDAILFKIVNVKPVKNAEGLTTSCDFEAIFFNRSATSISLATIDLSWMDKVAASTIEEEKKAQPSPNISKRIGGGKSVTAETSSADVSLSINVPFLSIYKQVMVKGNVATDRCFLLINTPTIDVDKCEAVGNEGDCAGFVAVTARDPQFYRDFKEVDYEEQKQVEKSRREKLREEIDAEFSKVVSSMEDAARVLTSIK